MKKQKWCQKCGGPMGKSVHESLCQKCIKSLPRCWNCTIICGAEEEGYHAEPKAIPCRLKKSGIEIILCGGCGEKISKNEDLITDGNRKIPAKEIKIINSGPNQ